MRGLRDLAFVAAVLTSGLCSAPARAAEPVPFTPSGAWTADFAEDSCSLERSFTHEQDTLHLRIRQFVPGDRFEITVASETLVPRRRAADIEFATAVGSSKIDYFQTFGLFEGLKGVVFSTSFAAERGDQ